MLPDKAPAVFWYVAINRSPEAQASILVTSVSAADVAAEAAALQAACAAARAAAVYAVRISGATGDFSGRVNGLYEVTDEISGGMPVYKKQGGEQWLEYHVSTSCWMSKSTASKGQTKNLCHAYVDCAIGVMPDNAPIGAWNVFSRSSSAFACQASIAISPVSVTEVAAVQAACAAARAAATYSVRISGATFACVVNGLYEVMDEVSGGMPVYKKRGGEQWLEYHVSTSQWLLRATASKGQTSNLGFARVECAIGVLPDKAPRGTWCVAFNGSPVAQESVVVSQALR